MVLGKSTINTYKIISLRDSVLPKNKYMTLGENLKKKHSKYSRNKLEKYRRGIIGKRVRVKTKIRREHSSSLINEILKRKTFGRRKTSRSSLRFILRTNLMRSTSTNKNRVPLCQNSKIISPTKRKSKKKYKHQNLCPTIPFKINLYLINP